MVLKRGLKALRWASIVYVGAFVSLPVAVDAQLIPGQGRVGYWEAERARLRSERLQELSPVMEAWRAGWNDAAPEQIVSLYSSDAVLTMGGLIHQGREAIADALKEMVPGLGRLELGLNDFITGGGLVVALESVVVGSGNARRTATLLTTFVQTDDGWRIRAQTFSDSVNPVLPQTPEP